MDAIADHVPLVEPVHRLPVEALSGSKSVVKAEMEQRQNGGRTRCPGQEVRYRYWRALVVSTSRAKVRKAIVSLDGWAAAEVTKPYS